MAKKKKEWNKIILYTVVVIVTLSTIALYTPMFFGSSSKPKKSHFIPPKGTPYAKGPTSSPPKVLIITPSNSHTNQTSTVTSTPISNPTPEGTLNFNL